MNINEITTPQEVSLLVALTDLTGYTRIAQTYTNQEIFAFLSDYYAFTSDIIEESGGSVLKFIGDAILFYYPEEKVNQGALALKTLQEQGDAWLAKRNLSSKHIIKAHFGPVICGHIGSANNKHFDIFGQTMNIMVTLKSNGLAITPQLFRQLDSDTRKHFKKHTPPITYIPKEASHKD